MSVVRKFRVVGISALLMNNPTSMGGGAGASVGTKKIPTPEDEARSKIYADENGQYYIPSVSFRSAIIGKGGAASGLRIGKSTAIARCCAGLFNVGEKCLLVNAKTGKPIKTHAIHVCRAVIQGNGVLRSRPMIENWATVVEFEIDEDFVGVDMVLQLLNRAGKTSGVLDFRPQKKGVFGRFSATLEE